MTFDDALAYYKSGKAIAKALSLSPARVTYIKQSGFIPYRDQCVLEIDSKRKLRARKEDDTSYYMDS